MKANQVKEARDLFLKIITINPKDAEAWHMLSTINGKLGNFDDAETCCRNALALKNDYADAYVNLGHIYSHRGNHQEALKHYQRAARLNPDSPIVHLNIGNIFNALGIQDEAINSYRQAIRISPMFADAYNNLGNIHLERGEDNEAISCYIKALEINPLLAASLNNLAKVCQSQQHINRYIEFYRHAVTRLPDPAETRSSFIKVLARMPFSRHDPWLDEELQKCLNLNGIDFRPLGSVTANLLKDKYNLQGIHNPDEGFIQDTIKRIASDNLFILFLKKVVNVDPDLETLFTRIRRNLLFKAKRITDISHHDGTLIAALAYQCFNNEYIFAQDTEEEKKLNDLKRSIEQRAANKQAPDNEFETLLRIAGMYENLFSLSCGISLAGYPPSAWSEEFSLYAQQALYNHFIEDKIKERIESLGAIKDQTSQLVQSQYEDNPYPRWLTISNKKGEINTIQHLKSLLPNFSPPQFLKGPIKVLIAGCGTGKHAMLAALSYSNAEILAVDISKSSLAYAIRMAEKYNIKNIQFKQADILELSRLRTQFHIIECQGVLHHMEDPIKGWRILTDLLITGGLMSIGLYSEKARRTVVAARKIIEREAIAPNTTNIRDFRLKILRNEIPDLRNAFRNSYDFYTMSTCRDLLFHYKEHRFTLPQINTILDDLNFNFLGFTFSDSKATNMYQNQFPDDRNMTNLLLWDRFESSHPDTFAAMYKFFCQKTE